MKYIFTSTFHPVLPYFFPSKQLCAFKIKALKRKMVNGGAQPR